MLSTRRSDTFHRDHLGAQCREVYGRIRKGVLEGRFPFSVGVGDLDIDGEGVGRAFRALTLDNPMFYGLGINPIAGDHSRVEDLLVESDYDFVTRGMIDRRIEDRIAEVYRNHVTGCRDQLETIMAVHDWVRDSSVYHRDPTDPRIPLSEFHSVVGVMVHGKGVCSSISYSVSLLLNAFGVRANSLVGVAGGPHQWNIVYVDGGWRHLDVTFDIGTDSLAYFLLGDRACSHDRTWEAEEVCIPPDGRMLARIEEIAEARRTSP